MKWKDTGVGIQTMDGFLTITARLKETERYPISQTWVSRMVSEFKYLPANWILA